MLSAVGVASSNLVASVAFYAALGVTFADGAGAAPDARHVEGTTAGGCRVMLDSVDLLKSLAAKSTVPWEDPRGTAVTLCFEQPSPADVDSAFAAGLRAGGRTRTAPWDAFWGQRYASLLDPDGNQVDVFAALPPPAAAPAVDPAEEA